MNPLEDAARLGIELSPGQADALRIYHQLLRERAVPLGMVARGDADRLYPRHIRDSLAAAPLFRDSDRSAYDLGSGAGLPGVVLAISVPWVRFHLVESRARRAGFLELVVDRLGLRNAEVVVGRVEDLAGPADVATARAFAPLERSWRVARPLLHPGGRLVYFAGRRLAPQRLRQDVAALKGMGDVATASPLDSSGTLVIMSRT